MADAKISALPAATTPLAGTEVLPVVQSGVTDKVTVANLTAGRAVSALSLTSTNNSTINGVSVGIGAGAVTSNTAVGASALGANTTGARHVAVGYEALRLNTTASNNTAVGYQAVYSNTDGTSITAVGYQALYAATTDSSNSTAVGWRAGYNNTSGEITGIGDEALYTNSTGTNNTAVGVVCLYTNNGSNNTAMGRSAMRFNTSGGNNTGVGHSALYSNTTTSNNTAFGYQAGYNCAAASNTFIGYQAGYVVTSGAKNTVLGGYTGNLGGLDIRTTSNNIVISDGDGNPRWIGDSTGAMGYGPTTGGTVTQLTNRTTGVTLNKPTGQITLVSAAGTATWQSFTVTNNTVKALDTVRVVQQSGTDLCQIHVTNVAAGSFQITFATTGGTTTEQPVFNFAVIKGQSA